MDESIHSVGVGYEAQKLFAKFPVNTQNELKAWAYELLIDLYENECKYTEDIYEGTGLTTEVKKYVRYNGNKALQNIGFDNMFPEEEIHPVVANGIKVGGTTYDFFSQKGNTYTVAKVKPITAETFDFSDVADDY